MDPVLRWASSGAMALTGDADGPPLAPPTRAATTADELLAPFGLGAETLGERAAHLGLSRRGLRSAGGATELLECIDGWLALALPRPEDWESLPALLGAGFVGRGWEDVAAAVRYRTAEDLGEMATLLGMAAAVVGEGGASIEVDGRPRVGADPGRVPRVVDLSGLWAGPLCGHLLGRMGADVVKVESTVRPDGARRGVRSFFDLLNTGKSSVAVDHTTADGRAALARLVGGADVVISSSRRRAVEQLGLDPHAFLADGSDRVWVAITGHGWESARIGFGDDAAAAAGLVAWGGDGHPRFAADAVADPLCGAMAADRAWACWQAGGRWFLDTPLTGAAGAVVEEGSIAARIAETDGLGGWMVDGVAVAAPTYRRPGGEAAVLGADTEDELERTP